MTSETRPIRRHKLLLCDSCRAGEAREAAKSATEETRMRLNGTGLATLPARMPGAEFSKFFSCPSGAADTPTVLEFASTLSLAIRLTRELPGLGALASQR
jgi:hypothetical protein